MRLDCLLVERGLFPSREAACRALLAGRVSLGGGGRVKPGALVPRDVEVAIRGEPHPYASRGGVKLEAALRAFGVEPAGRIALDVGASTGGFTDCLLRAGAMRVYALDVGYGQIALRLRSDPRVVVMERRNARYLRTEDFPVRPTLATVDVSFISLRKILPPVARLLGEGGRIVALVKPQFEAERREVRKGGVVRDPEVHERVRREIEVFSRTIGLEVLGSMESPLRGPKGNREFFVHLAFRPGSELGGQGK